MEDHTQLILENLPVGLRFQPTDEELLNHYLMPKLLNQPINGVYIMVLDLSKYDPWDLLDQFKNSGDNEIYFFCHCEYNKSNGNRKRKAGGGHWKITGNPRPVRAGVSDDEIGTKRSLVFHNPAKTQFVITEYAYTAQLSSHIMEDFVLCKLKKKPINTKKIKKAGQYCKLQKRPNKKRRKTELSDGNTDSGSTSTCRNQNLKEMTADSSYTQSEESNHLAYYSENQHLNKTTNESTTTEFTQNLCKRSDISPSYKKESNNSIAMNMTIELPCDNGNKKNTVSQDFASQDPANSTDISASYEKPFDFDNKNQNDETDISILRNFWISILNSTGGTRFQGVQTGTGQMPVLEDNHASVITSSGVGDTMSPKNDRILHQQHISSKLSLNLSGLAEHFYIYFKKLPELLAQPNPDLDIKVVTLSEYDPWDLSAKFKNCSGEKEMYVFTPCEYYSKTGLGKNSSTCRICLH